MRMMEGGSTDEEEAFVAVFGIMRSSNTQASTFYDIYDSFISFLWTVELNTSLTYNLNV